MAAAAEENVGLQMHVWALLVFSLLLSPAKRMDIVFDLHSTLLHPSMIAAVVAAAAAPLQWIYRVP